ncbi:unnamed protein product [Schistosoma margrebowiei]|uniref:Gamma-tubulin complex component n=1 Tax=Schistosoma margrebowiei TaxID=48269 RepID=A0AA85A285_9TREM|nr:unnamed protein product [Schistosoma margrebowiei]
MAGHESTKNSIRHHVQALYKMFGVDLMCDPNMYAFADSLEKSTDNSADTQYNIHDLVTILRNDNPQYDGFLRRFEELKLKNIRELSSFVYLLSKLKLDDAILRSLEYLPLSTEPLNGQSNVSPIPVCGENIAHLQHVNDESCTQGSSSVQPVKNDSLRPMFGASDELSLFSACGLGADSSSFVQASKNTSKKLVSSNTVQPPTFPLQPEWIYSRETLWDDFLSISPNSESFQQLPIESLSNAVQEYAVVSDLLQCLQGNQGVYIKPLPLSNRYAVRCFKVDEKMTPSLSDTVNKILPLCSDYSTVARFIGEKSTFEYGTVNQALACAMRGLLKDYLILLCQLEYQHKIGQLGIVKLHFFLQETATAFNHLTRLVNNINTGHSDHYELPTCEELVCNKEHSVFLNKIDQAHLYASSLLLNLMLQQKDLKEHLKSVKRFFLLDQGDFIVHFMDAAAAELRKNSEIISQLRLNYLLELALRTSTANSDPFKDNLSVVIFQFDLISQILMVLRAGSEDVPDNVLPIEDKNLSGLEAFCLDYRVGWPIDLVLNRQVMDRYQMLFRHLLYCRHVERLLCNSWILGKLARKCDNLMTTWFTTAFLLAQRMLIFIQHLQYFMSVEIIEPAWHNFFKSVDKVSNLDLLLESHLHFLEVCMDDCLLASPDLLSLVGKLSVACVTFANFIQHLAFSITGINLSSFGDNDQCIVYSSRHSNDMERPFLHDPTPSSNLGRTKNDLKYAPRESTTSSVESMMTKVTREEFGRMSLSDDMAKTVTNFDTDFSRMLVELLEKVKQYAKHHSRLLSLVSRLDFNKFYTEFAMQYDQSERSPEPPGDHEPSLDKDTLVEHKSVSQTNSESDNEDYI